MQEASAMQDHGHAPEHSGDSPTSYSSQHVQRAHNDRPMRGPWGHGSDTEPLHRGDQRAFFPAPQQHKGNVRRQKQYRKLWEHVKSVHAGDTEGGRQLPAEMSVEELKEVCCSLPPDASAVAAVFGSLSYLDSRAMAALMKDLAKAQHLDRAMELFDWLKSLPPDDELYGLCDVYTFTTAISLMGPSQQLRRALELVGEMRVRGLHCNVHTYSALMNVCIKCDACDLALDVFKQMYEDRIKPNVVTYNTLVDVYGKTGQWEKAVQVLDDMRKEGLEPEVRTFNTAIIACNMCSQPHEALKVHQKLLDAGLQPISTTYTALISAYGKAGQLDKALETFQAMVRSGCERSVITYSALISACEKGGRWEMALDLFDQMQRERCTPNTVTYNSLITACQQGGQPDKACEVFEQMKRQGCRPDVVTYSALIAAYSKAGHWHRAVKAFEQMQQCNCKPDSFVHQTVIDSLWGTGVSWAQARAWQLYMHAARNWHFRFTLQLANSNNPVELEYMMPACPPGVGVLCLRKWLADMAAQAEADSSSLLGAGRERLLISLGRSRSSTKEGTPSDTSLALMEVLQGFNSPFRPGNGAVTAPGNLVVAEADMLAALNWLRCPELHEALALLVPCSAAASRQPSPLGQAGMKRMSFATELGEDAKLEDSCQRAYNTVLGFELAQRLDAGAMVPEYTAEREALIGSTFKLAGQFELADEVVFDAVLLMDRVMSTGTAHDTALGGLFVAAALRLAALQTVSGTDAAAMSGVPSDAALSSATGFPEGSVTKMEDNIRTALDGDIKCISMLRTLKLYLERMGADVQQDVPAAAHFSKAMLGLLRTVLVDPLALRWRPAVMAAATLIAARTAVGCHPAVPLCLQHLTRLSLEAAEGEEEQTELAAAVAAVQPLAASAGLHPPPRVLPHFGGRPVSAGGGLFGQFPANTPTFGSTGSGYSTPSHASTPTAAAAAAMAAAQLHFGLPQKSLLDAVVRQHHTARAGSDMSSRTCSEAGSAADLQALLSATAMAGGMAGGMAGSPMGTNPLAGFMAPASEPALAAAMAGLQLSMMQMQGGAGGFVPQMPWLGQGNAAGFDPYLACYQPQHPPLQQGSSRLQQMTTPYVTPAHMQQAMMLNNAAAQLLR